MKCIKTRTWTLRKDARARLLELWKRGDYRLRSTHWCSDHQGYHLTKRASAGTNWSYRD